MLAERAGTPELAGSSLKAALDLDWDDEAALGQALGVVLGAVGRVEALVAELAGGQDPGVAAGLQAVRQVRDQDVVVGADGTATIRQGVARDRRISVEDSQMRHGRKTRSQRVDGYKRHVLTDLDTGLVCAVGVTAAEEDEPDVVERVPVRARVSAQDLDFADLHPSLDELGARFVDVWDHQLQALERARRHGAPVRATTRCKGPPAAPGALPWQTGRVDLDSGAALLHRLTSLVPNREWDVPVDDPRVRHDLVPNDPGTRPPPMKGYPDGLPVLALPRDLPDPGVPASAVLAGVAPPAQPLDAAQLGRVLFLGAGVVRTAGQDGRRFLFRASGSAGARFPLEVYASTRGVAGVPDGVHWYDAAQHALVQVAPAATGAVTTLVVTGVPWRTGWRYAERGWRHLYWDAGTLLSQLSAVSASAGVAPRLRSLFPDAAVRELVGADGVHEYPLALLSLGGGEPAIGPTGQAVLGELPPVELPLCTAAQRAGERDGIGAPWPEAAALSDFPPSASLDEVVRRRGSQRRMDRSRTLPRPLLEWPMAAALRGVEAPHWVAVHGVDDVALGLYRWPDLSTPLRAADLRDELLRICLDQALAADAAYVVIAATPMSALDDRGYRDAQLAAGLVEGRLHLAACALGASASGMTFLDSEVPGLLGEPDDLATLLFTCVGVPEYASRAGGGPGAPVEVRPVAPRLGGSRSAP